MRKLFAVLLLSASMMFAQHGGGHQGGGFHGNAPTPRPEQREYRGEQREYHSGWHRFGEPGHREFRPFYGGVRIFSTPICPPRVFVYVGPPVGQYKCAAPGDAVLARLRRRGQALVTVDLLRRAALVNGRESQEAGQAGRGSAAVYPGQLECRQRQGQVLGPDDEAALFLAP